MIVLIFNKAVDDGSEAKDRSLNSYKSMLWTFEKLPLLDKRF